MNRQLTGEEFRRNDDVICSIRCGNFKIFEVDVGSVGYDVFGPDSLVRVTIRVLQPYQLAIFRAYEICISVINTGCN